MGEAKNFEEPEVPMVIAILVFFGFTVLTAMGHVRNFFEHYYTLLVVKSFPKYQSVLPSGFELFFSRFIFGRVHDRWNHTISTAGSTMIHVLDRDRITGTLGSFTNKTVFNGTRLECLNLGSYNYLGFGDANSPTREAVLEVVDQFGATTGSPRADLGTTTVHRETEKVVARFLEKEDAMIVGMGFGTNSTVLNRLAGPGTLILSDALNHASIVAGTRSSGAKTQVFKHNDTKDLEQVIRTAIVNGQPGNKGPWDKILIVVEGIYSMEGEMCALPGIVELKKKYGCYLYVDEAHSIGAIGATGRGIAEFTGVSPHDIDIFMGTFTKSFGSVGGYIAGDRNVIDYLRSTSSGSLHSASISPPACQQIISSFKIIMGEDGTDLGQKKLRAIYENANYFRNEMRRLKFHVLGGEGSPVVPVMLYLPSQVALFAKLCLNAGIAVVVVGFPATPLLLSRVRFCISAAHTKEELREAAEKIRIIGNIVGARYDHSIAALDQFSQ